MAQAQPANDNCANAIPIVPTTTGVMVSGTTTGATTDGATNCGSSTSPDVWYTFTLDQARFVTATLCAGASWDTVVSIHSACPGTAANSVACNDDHVQSSVPGWDRAECGDSLLHPRQRLQLEQHGRVHDGRVRQGQPAATAPPPPPPPPPPPLPSVGPDVIIGELFDVGYFGQVGDILAYAIGTDACNAGTITVPWTTSSAHHPVIAQNFYRLKGGKFEQVGQSWLKHGFAARGRFDVLYVPGRGRGGLGPGCSDIYSSGLNGTQGPGRARR